MASGTWSLYGKRMLDFAEDKEKVQTNYGEKKVMSTDDKKKDDENKEKKDEDPEPSDDKYMNLDTSPPPKAWAEL